ncbi:unnamed protein product [Gongylonema pulchrum]|uniref:Transmembrane protein n=1 Tax=Gongylonema pulchrum TaxID=637853 RepID=A0A183F1P5_9BILA|nr:unnamed protein product [Gongylonema pulchrum]
MGRYTSHIAVSVVRRRGWCNNYHGYDEGGAGSPRVQKLPTTCRKGISAFFDECLLMYYTGCVCLCVFVYVLLRVIVNVCVFACLNVPALYVCGFLCVCVCACVEV